MTEREYLLAVAAFIPFGPARINLLLNFFGGAKKVWLAKEEKLIKVGLGVDRTKKFLEHRRNFDFKKYFNQLNRHNVNFLTKDDKEYPQNLSDLDDAPVVLYIKGKFSPQDVNAVAIVGSRKMTSYGREVSERFSAELAAFGVTVVSGLARGIDSAAHQSALAAGGRTLAVLGCGLDTIYPPENLGLAREIIKNGALLSEYPLGHPAVPINFAARNRIISGLAKAVLIIEGAQKSGTLLTASHAAKQGREVFAVPGQITSPLSAAPLFLLKNGAKMATAAKDILEELNIQTIVNREEVEKVLPSNQEEELFLSILENENMHIDEIARISSLEVSSVSARLTIMELKGLVKNLGGGVYKKVG